MRRFGFGAVLLALLAVTAVGQDAVTIKAPQPKAGDKVRVTKTEKSKASTRIAVGGQTQAKDEAGTKFIVYVDEVITIAAGAAKPTKLKRTYEKYEVTRGGKDEKGPPLNTTILIEKQGEKYTFTADGKPVEPVFAAKLSAEFDKASTMKPEDLLPKKPVKPGDTWKLEGEKFLAALGGEAKFTFDPDKSALTGKLVKTYQKDGKQFGVIDLDGGAALVGIGDQKTLTLKPGGKMAVKMTLDGCIDGSVATAKMSGTFSVTLDAEGKGFTLGVVAEGTNSETLEPLGK